MTIRKCPYVRLCDAGSYDNSLCDICQHKDTEPRRPVVMSFFKPTNVAKKPDWYTQAGYLEYKEPDGNANTVYCSRDCENQGNGFCHDAGVAIDDDGYCTGYSPRTPEKAACKECTTGKAMGLCAACPINDD